MEMGGKVSSSRKCFVSLFLISSKNDLQCLLLLVFPSLSFRLVGRFSAEFP